MKGEDTRPKKDLDAGFEGVGSNGRILRNGSAPIPVLPTFPRPKPGEQAPTNQGLEAIKRRTGYKCGCLLSSGR